MKALSLKKLLGAITNYHVMKSATPTKTNSSVWISGSITCLRRGDVVTVKFNQVSFGAVSQRTDFALIPDGFIPSTETGGLLDSSSLWVFCRPTGTIAVNPLSATATHWGTVTYLASN